MYLDDGFGCGIGQEYMQTVSNGIKLDLIASGFVPKVDKCTWEPVQVLTWLGAVLNSENLTISIPQSRIEKAIKSVNDLLSLSRVNRYVHVRSVASAVGQIISMSIVIGSVSQIMTRCLSIDILKARTWNSYIKLSEESCFQLRFWAKSLCLINSRNIAEFNKCSKIMVSDASGTGYASYEVNTINGIVHGMWSLEETLRSSTWRELCAVQRSLKALEHILENQRVKWLTDNQNVCRIVKKGSMKPDLQSMALDIFGFCSSHGISLETEWLPRTSDAIARADYMSRIIDRDDWGISFEILHLLRERWGMPEVDWFASAHNAKLPVFYSRFWNPGSSGVDAFTENWGSKFGLFVPPVILVARVLKQMQAQRARGILVIPYWPSAVFWPLICCEHGGFIKNVLDWVDLPRSKSFYTPCKNDKGLFGIQNLKFRMLALNVNYRDA